jgi:hypothetical protein
MNNNLNNKNDKKNNIKIYDIKKKYCIKRKIKLLYKSKYNPLLYPCDINLFIKKFQIDLNFSNFDKMYIQDMDKYNIQSFNNNELLNKGVIYFYYTLLYKYCVFGKLDIGFYFIYTNIKNHCNYWDFHFHKQNKILILSLDWRLLLNNELTIYLCD